MDIKLGSTPINKMYLGSTEIKKMYLGGNVWTPPAVGGSYAVFDGSSYIDFGNPSELQITDNLRVEVKTKSFTTGVSDYYAVASFGSEDWYAGFFGGAQPTIDGLFLSCTQNGSYTGPYIFSYTDNAIGQTDKVSCEFVASDDTIFKVNDVTVASTEATPSIPSIAASPTSTLQLGARSGGDLLDADIEYIKIYDGATLVLDFDPAQYGDLLDHSAYAHPSTNNGVTLG